MRHLNDDDLVLAHYGEGDSAADLHLAGCADCRARVEELRADLAPLVHLPVPERDDRYAERVHRAVLARVHAAPALERSGWPRPLLYAAAAAVLAGVFWLGQRTAGVGEPIPIEVRERILLVAVGDHLERSERLLVELSHAPGDGPVDVSGARATAGRLALENRLYRQTAAASGSDAVVADLLTELERLLIDIANGPENLARSEIAELQRRIERRGILLKIRIVSDGVRQEQPFALPPRT